METLKMTQALDEKNFLKIKITTAITNFNPITVVRPKDTVYKNKETFEKDAKATYQSIVDQIDRYNRLSSAIIKANAEAIIEVKGITMSRAEAISLRTQLKSDDNLEQKLLSKMRHSSKEASSYLSEFQNQLDSIRDKYASNMIVSNGTKEKSLSDDDIEVINKLSANYVPEVIDPISLEDKITSYGDKYDNLLQELETAIKLSNATTDVTF